ncbi:MAG: DUF3006 family protein [Halovenus sp.]
MDGTYTATVDRIVDGTTAVLLLEEDGDVAAQLEVPVEALPDEAQADRGVLTVTVEDGELIDVAHRRMETRKRRESARERLARLSERLSER